MNSPILTIVSFIIIFTVVVVSHEFGHFIIARANGIRVNEFMIGMGPVLYRKMGKQTELTIRLLPIGGACVFDGEDGNERVANDAVPNERTEQKRAALRADTSGMRFPDAPVWGRIAAVLAGPVFNVLLALFLALPIVWVYGADLPVLSAVSEGLPAEAAGLKAGDTIIELNGHRVHVWREIMIRSYMSNGAPMTLVYERDGVRDTVVITPQWSAEDGRYYIGFSGAGAYQNCRNLSVLPYGWYEVRYWLDATIQSLKYMVSGHASLDDLAGPVGVANVIDQTIEDVAPAGGFHVFMNMVNIAVLLSVNLGVMNLLPIPALDGGRLLFLIFEAASGRKVPPEKEGVVHLIGFVLLMVLMVVVLFNDITRFFR